jgi:D-lactate dehydrogenase
MKVAVFDSHSFDREALEAANRNRHELAFLNVRLTIQTAQLAAGYEAVCLFANDKADRGILETLAKQGVRLIALRSAGFNHVDIQAAKYFGLTVVRVPEYSPHAVAEYAVALLLTWNRKIHRASARVHEMNFSLEGLVGFDLFGKTVGVVGTGRIGKAAAQIFHGFGCRVLAFDHKPDGAWADQYAITYCGREELFANSDIVSLHVPLSPSTLHIVNADVIKLMKPASVLVNTGRGGLVETGALIDALKRRMIAGACLDVYEEEAGIFFNDLSESGINDDLLARLLTFPNVLLTSHQAFLTREALKSIAETTIESLTKFARSEDLGNVVVR